jgi:hypothetical protein
MEEESPAKARIAANFSMKGARALGTGSEVTVKGNTVTLASQETHDAVIIGY